MKAAKKFVDNLSQENLSQEDLSMLLNISQTLNSTLDFEEILHQALERFVEVVHAEASSIWLIDELFQELYVASATGEKSEDIKKVRMEMGKGIVGQVISKKRPVIVPDARKVSEHARDVAQEVSFEARTVLCVPMFYKD
ncbi:GAF domain-containing protein [Candidatus Poribacteria bacterium]|nr:GAF domain-containing protein [Candidatus Poribacteria bacterium]